MQKERETDGHNRALIGTRRSRSAAACHASPASVSAADPRRAARRLFSAPLCVGLTPLHVTWLSGLSMLVAVWPAPGTRPTGHPAGPSSTPSPSRAAPPPAKAGFGGDSGGLGSSTRCSAALSARRVLESSRRLPSAAAAALPLGVREAAHRPPPAVAAVLACRRRRFFVRQSAQRHVSIAIVLDLDLDADRLARRRRVLPAPLVPPRSRSQVRRQPACRRCRPPPQLPRLPCVAVMSAVGAAGLPTTCTSRSGFVVKDPLGVVGHRRHHRRLGHVAALRPGSRSSTGSPWALSARAPPRVP